MTEESDRPHYRIRRVYVGGDELVVELRDGREIIASLDAFPVLQEASEEEQRKWTLIGMDQVIRWPDLSLRVSLDDLPPPTTTW